LESSEKKPLDNSTPGVVIRDRFHQRFPLWTLPVTLILTLLAWEALTRWSGLPDFMLPSPQAVGSRLIRALSDGSLLRHTWVTLLEVLGGLALGLSVATCLGYGLAKSRTIERLLAPYIVASQSVPVVAVAPLLVIWFGPGKISKLLISGLIVFFPVLVNTIVGVRSVPEDLRDLMRSLRATRWQIFTKLEVPAAMPIIFGGLKVGATLSVIGAVVGEFVGADEGLGFLINVGRGLYDTALVFVVVFDLIGMALTLYGIVAGLERRLLAWREIPTRLQGG
jgi:NitT/TauT family transport system permease protein